VIAEALAMPGGARFFRCAFQVNPYSYLKENNKRTAFSNEPAYNASIVATCLDLGIEVIAITDHSQVKTSVQLWQAARAAGIAVFPGCEVKTKDGIHILCLFDPTTDLDRIEHFLGSCGIRDAGDPSQTSDYDVLELLKHTREWAGICIAAHVVTSGGLLQLLRGRPTINAWQCDDLLAVALSAPLAEAPEAMRLILENKDPQYHRDRPLAIVNARDVDDPEHLRLPSATTLIKMSRPSVEGLRQAFLAPGSRIRQVDDPPPEGHSEFVAMAWEGGFLDGVRLRFNDNLNVLIGGRGTGKSTVIESLRYVVGLEPIGEDARRAHDGIVRHVLKPGTKLSLLVRSHRPNLQEFVIERSVPNPPVVRAADGRVINLAPSAILPRVELYGQHEISELTRSPERLTLLLGRFVGDTSAIDAKRTSLRRSMERSRTLLLQTQHELTEVADRLAALPNLEETMRRFTEAGLEERLRDQSLLVREERLLQTAGGRVTSIADLISELKGSLPIDRAFLSSQALDSLPGRDYLADADRVLSSLSTALQDLATRMQETVEAARLQLADVNTRWQGRKATVDTAYQRILRELQQSKVDGEEFIRLRRQIEDLRPLKEREATLRRALDEESDGRRNLLAEWDDLKAAAFRTLQNAAARVSHQLEGRVRVTVALAGDREPLLRLLREHVSGRLSESTEILRDLDQLSLRELADTCRKGAAALNTRYSFSPSQAERLARAAPDVFMQIEELELPSTTEIKLNVAPEGEPPAWQSLDALSTGQKATAVLLLLLLESDAPLVVDQPEDDLDNRFISDGVVPKMRAEKRRRQFVFATHNANIPVLGDADLILGLSASGEAVTGRAQVRPEHMGSIDSPGVQELAEEILEGGKEAFEMRRLKYGF